MNVHELAAAVCIVDACSIKATGSAQKRWYLTGHCVVRTS